MAEGATRRIKVFKDIQHTINNSYLELEQLQINSRFSSTSSYKTTAISYSLRTNFLLTIECIHQ